jgi:3-isopropylmalate dehydrogenase
MQYKVVLLPGDGIGPEVICETARLLEAVIAQAGHEILFCEHLIGGCSIDRYGEPLTDEALADCLSADAVLLGAVGGPKWDDPTAKVRPEQGLLRLRKEMQVYANLRPVKVHPALAHISPLKPEKLAGVDILVLRELTGGLYFGQPKGVSRNNGSLRAVDTLEYADYEIRRVLHLAFRLARGRRFKVTSVDKANVLESSRLWRQIASEASQDYPDVTLEHMLVDTASMRLIADPVSFDVLVTENMFGDILTDEASVLAGSMGMLPSASLGEGQRGLYEPIHGSAPDIAGQGVANPIGAMLSAALMLRYSLNLPDPAAGLEQAVNQAITDGCRTRDLGGDLSTKQLADEILDRLPGGHFLGL